MIRRRAEVNEETLSRRQPLSYQGKLPPDRACVLFVEVGTLLASGFGCLPPPRHCAREVMGHGEGQCMLFAFSQVNYIGPHFINLFEYHY